MHLKDYKRASMYCYFSGLLTHTPQIWGLLISELDELGLLLTQWEFLGHINQNLKL